jgi:hypothetical protein
MKVKLIMFLIVPLLSVWFAQGDGTDKISLAMESSIATATDDGNIIPSHISEPFVGRMDLNSETEKFFYGTWKVEKLLGFSNSYNDASEYPTGQQVIGDEITITKDYFSSTGLERYNVYQYELKNPIYNITHICYNEDSFYRIFKMDMLDLNINDEVKALRVSDSSTGLAIPVSFLSVNHDRLILVLEAAQFELTRVTE